MAPALTDVEEGEKIEDAARIRRKSVYLEFFLKMVLPCFLLLVVATLIILLPGEKLTKTELVLCITLPSVLFALSWLSFIFAEVLYKSSVLAITNKHLILKAGLRGSGVTIIDLADIEQVSVEKEHGSNILVVTLKERELHLAWIDDVMRAQTFIKNAIKNDKK